MPHRPYTYMNTPVLAHFINFVNKLLIYKYVYFWPHFEKQDGRLGR